MKKSTLSGLPFARRNRKSRVNLKAAFEFGLQQACRRDQFPAASGRDGLTIRQVLEKMHAHALAFQKHKEAEGTMSGEEAFELDRDVETGRLLIELICESNVDQSLGQRAKNYFDALTESMGVKENDRDRYHAALFAD